MPFIERGAAASLMSAGGQIGTILMWLLGPYLVQGATGWPGTFYVPAALVLLWSLFWCTLWTSSPEANHCTLAHVRVSSFPGMLVGSRAH